MKSAFDPAAPVADNYHGRRLAKHADKMIYHGPMEIPEPVALRSNGAPLYRTRRGNDTVSRVSDPGVVYLFRRPVPESRQMIGDIRRESSGRLRVVCWAEHTRPDGRSVRTPIYIAAAKAVPTASNSELGEETDVSQGSQHNLEIDENG